MMHLLFLLLTIAYPNIEECWKSPDPLSELFLGGPQSIEFMDAPLLQSQAKLYLSQKDPDLRARMILQMRGSNNPAAILTLQELYRKESLESLRADLLESVLFLADRLNEPVPRPDFATSGLKNAVPSARAAAAEILASSGKHRAPVLTMLAVEPSEFAADRVTKRLIQKGVVPATSDLVAFAKHPDSEVRAVLFGYAARMLAAPDASAELVRAARPDETLLVRTRLAQGLAANPNTSGVLLESLAKSDAVPVRAAAAAATGKHTEALVVSLAADGSETVRLHAAKALASFSGIPSEKALLKLLCDASLPVRKAATDALIARQNGPELPDGAEALQTDSNAVDGLLLLIAKTRNKRYSTLVESLMKRHAARDYTVWCGLTALGTSKDPARLPFILSFRDHKNPRIRCAMADAIDEMDDPRTHAVLQQMLLEEGSFEPLLHALYAAERFRRQDYGKTFVRALSRVDAPEAFRAGVARALGRLPQFESSVLPTLDKILMKPYIVIGPGMVAFDSDGVRASALLLLLHGANSSDSKDNAGKMLDRICSAIEKPGQKERETGIQGSHMLEYVAQVRALRKGIKRAPGSVACVAPELVYYELDSVKK